MAANSNRVNNNNESMELTRTWAGRLVQIRGEGGWMAIDRPTHNTVVSTTSHAHIRGALRNFRIEAVPDMPGVVSFRVDETDLYLTNIMYGDRERQAVATELASVPGILADNIGLIVDFAVGRPTDDNNFEGAGFHYNPMTVQRSGGPRLPNKLQMFRLERAAQPTANRPFGIKSLFGTYWRSQHWNKTVSQSSHLLGDEKWYFSAV